MLQRRTTPDGLAFYQSPLLNRAGVPHAFSTRLGGVSRAPFDALNLGNPNGCALQDDTDHIAENYRRLLAAAGCAGRRLCRVHQVHGTAVVRVRPGGEFDHHAKADALVGDDPARVLSVRTADCVPVLLATDDGRAVAAVHAGWRGVVAGVAAAAAYELLALAAGPGKATVNGKADASRLLAAVGPCIGFESFEVGPEVLEEFARVFGEQAPIRVRVGNKGLVDLREAIRQQLTGLGVPPDRIDTTDRCTHRDADEFFSHRRENGVTGRMASVIGCH
jgi:polyphenol oxidase